MLINAFGPPAVGKSSLLAKFLLEHPYFKFCTIDAYRIELYDSDKSFLQNEEDVWNAFLKDIKQSKDVIVETCGLNYQLDNIVNKSTNYPVVNVQFIGELNELQKRLKTRQKMRPLPPQFRPEDEFEMLRRCQDYKKFKGDLVVINTTNQSFDETYSVLSRQIVDIRTRKVKENV